MTFWRSEQPPKGTSMKGGIFIRMGVATTKMMRLDPTEYTGLVDDLSFLFIFTEYCFSKVF